MRRFLIFCTTLVLLYGSYLSTLDESKLPPLHNADVVFQTTWTDQSIAIGLASTSLYIHTGIVKQTDHGPVVIEAGAHVQETPLHDWFQHGILKRFSVYRYKGLTDEQAAAVVAAAKAYYGKPYDHYFYFGKDAIYCSELIYDAFQDASIPLGHPEKIGTLNINNRFVKALIEQRWRQYPLCQDSSIDFAQCYDIIMSQELITPQGLADDPHLEKIFSNYP